MTIQNAIVPTVLSENRAYDLYSRMLKDRIVFLTGEVNSAQAELIISQLLYLEAEDPTAPITFYINSPGGSVTAGFAIYDTMQFISCPVHTICLGLAASMGAFLLSAGARGYRYALPHSRVMIHQPLGGTHGQSTDIEIYTENIKFLKEILTKRLAEHCQRTYEELKRDCDRDYWMTAEECVEYGLIDKVLPYRNPSIAIASLRELQTLEDFTPTAMEAYLESKKEQAEVEEGSDSSKSKSKAKTKGKSTAKTSAKSTAKGSAKVEAEESSAEEQDEASQSTAKKSVKSTAKDTLTKESSAKKASENSTKKKTTSSTAKSTRAPKAKVTVETSSTKSAKTTKAKTSEKTKKVSPVKKAKDSKAKTPKK